MMILDYNDLIKTGAIITDEIAMEESGDRKYAVRIKTASQVLNKFDITDKESTQKSIEALSINKDIPADIRKAAEYYVKQAAEYFDIDYDIEVTPTPHEIVYHADVMDKKASAHPVLKIAGHSFIIEDIDDLKDAEEFFINRRNQFSPDDRIQISTLIDKFAEDQSYDTSDIIKSYAGQSYGDSVKALLDMRKSAMNNEGNKTLKQAGFNAVIDDLKLRYSSIPVSDFLSMVEDLDKIAGINPIKRNIDYYRFLHKTPAESNEKIAEEKKISAHDIINKIV